MKKYIVPILAVAITVFSGCKKFLSEVNIDTTQFTTATPAAILQGSFKATTDFLANDNGQRWWDLSNFIWAGARYDLTGDNVWQLYVNALEGITQLKQTYGNDSNFVNQVQIARIWESYVYYILVANYGPVAKSQANNLNYNSNIKYDNEDTVYRQILDTLKDAVSRINLNHPNDKLAYDVIYGTGSDALTKWIKFGNTLRLEIALTCRRNLGSYADGHIKDVMANDANTINSEDETAKITYENVTNNMHPYYMRYKFNTNTLPVPVMNDMLFLYFRSYQDPRMGAYFDSVPMRNRYLVRDTLTSKLDTFKRVVTYPIPYFGRSESSSTLPGWTSLAGQVNPISGISDTSYSYIKGFGWGISTDPLPSGSLVAANRPFIILSYAQAEFLKAEAAALGLGGSQSAQQYYEQGIAANFAYWGISSKLAAYMNVDGIKWDTKGDGFYNYLGIVKADIPQDNLGKIWIQSWINFFPDQAFEAWTLQRRTRALELSPMTNPGSGYINVPYMDIPERTPYPANNSKLNPIGYADALTQLGIGGQVDDRYPYVALHFEVPFTVKDWNAVVPHYNTAYVQKWYGNTVQALDSAGVPYTLLTTIGAPAVPMDLQRTGWTAYASNDPNELKNLFDNSLTTRWSTVGPQAPGQYLAVNLQQNYTIDTIKLNQSTSANDYPRGYDVYITKDSTNFGTPVVSGVGQSGASTVIPIPGAGVVGKYIKIVQTGSTTGYWSVYEFNVTGHL